MRIALCFCFVLFHRYLEGCLVDVFEVTNTLEGDKYISIDMSFPMLLELVTALKEDTFWVPKALPFGTQSGEREWVPVRLALAPMYIYMI
jgi:hypothetical protein